MLKNASQVEEQARILHGFHLEERETFDVVRLYATGLQDHPQVIPSTAPREVRVMQQASRVNVLSIVIDSLVQSTFVDGFRAKLESDDAEVWQAWQANRMDARQAGIHRTAFTYGLSYAVVVPGDSFPVIRDVSPRSMTTLYGEDRDWPVWAFERMGGGSWRLYDDEAVYFLAEDSRSRGEFKFLESRRHGAGVTPVVRYLDKYDPDAEDEVEPSGQHGNSPVITRGQIAALMTLQDQIDMQTFYLTLNQHYGGFRQRWIIGWTADEENDRIKVGGSQVMTFDEDPESMKIGEFGQTDPKGGIDAREATIRHVAALSQTPAHELIGQMINMSAEALAAAEAGRDRKVGECHTLLGESHEQTMWLAGKYMGVAVPDDAQVVWRDTSARSFAAMVDGLGKLTTMLGIPPQELWERVPGATRQDVQRWKAAAQQGNSFQVLADMLNRQGADAGGNGNTPTPAFG